MPTPTQSQPHAGGEAAHTFSVSPYGGNFGCLVKSPTGIHLFTAYGDSRTDAEINARERLRACNAHAALVAALESQANASECVRLAMKAFNERGSKADREHLTAMVIRLDAVTQQARTALQSAR